MGVQPQCHSAVRKKSWNLQSRVKQDCSLSLISKKFSFEIFTVIVKSEFKDIHCRFFGSYEVAVRLKSLLVLAFIFFGLCPDFYFYPRTKCVQYGFTDYQQGPAKKGEGTRHRIRGEKSGSATQYTLVRTEAATPRRPRPSCLIIHSIKQSTSKDKHITWYKLFCSHCTFPNHVFVNNAQFSEFTAGNLWEIRKDSRKVNFFYKHMKKMILIILIFIQVPGRMHVRASSSSEILLWCVRLIVNR